MGERLEILRMYLVKWKPKTGQDQHFIVHGLDEADARDVVEMVSDEIEGEQVSVEPWAESELSKLGFVAQVLLEVED